MIMMERHAMFQLHFLVETKKKIHFAILFISWPLWQYTA